MTDGQARLIALLSEVAKGRSDALHDLYRLTSAKLYGITLRVTGDSGGAQEAMQDAYVKIWRKADVFDPDRASPITWMATIARNAAIDWKRRNRIAAAQVDEGDASAWPAPAVDGLEQLEARSVRHHILRCIDGLDPASARAIRTAFYDGMTHSEVAAHLNVPLGTVKSWIRRAMIALRTCIDEAG